MRRWNYREALGMDVVWPAPMLGSEAQSNLAHSLLFALPGTPVLRCGDEIGMGNDYFIRERDAVRTPMHWPHERQAGFPLNAKTALPVISKGPFACDEVSVAAQRRDPNSLFDWTARMIRLRKECPEIGWGTWTVLKAGSPCVLAHRYDWRVSSLIALHNFSDKRQEVRIRPGVEGGELLVNLIHDDERCARGNGTHRLSIEAHGYRWYGVAGQDALFRQGKA
jgi:maltose alpha-D-glucosyltransferase / alpha-amylase